MTLKKLEAKLKEVIRINENTLNVYRRKNDPLKVMKSLGVDMLANRILSAIKNESMGELDNLFNID